MAIQAILPRALDANGSNSPGAKAWFYDTGTTSAQTVYSDTSLSTAHTQPVVSDANGVFPQVFGAGTVALKVVLTDASDAALPEGTLDPVATSSLSVSGAGQVSFAPTADIAQTNVQDAIEEVFTDSLQNVSEDTTPQLGGVLDADSNQVRLSKGADVASAAELTLGDDGNAFDVTGTTSITSIATKAVGTTVVLQFDAALTLTHHATDLILPTGANITTAAGDIAVFYEYAAGDWRCVSYARADGTALASRPDLFSGTFSSWSDSGGETSIAHGMSSTPKDWFCYFECTTADAGFAIGDRVPVNYSHSSGGYNGAMTYADATNIYVRIGSAGMNAYVTAGNGYTTDFSGADWDLKVEVRA